MNAWKLIGKTIGRHLILFGVYFPRACQSAKFMSDVDINDICRKCPHIIHPHPKPMGWTRACLFHKSNKNFNTMRNDDGELYFDIRSDYDKFGETRGLIQLCDLSLEWRRLVILGDN